MRRKENVRRRSAGRRLFPGILLGAVCLFSACSGKEAVFTAGETAEYWEASAGVGETDAQDAADFRGGKDIPGANISTETRVPLAVYVCGQVNAPGVYELEEGSRIGDAVSLAGGMREEAAADALNLAQLLEDGQMIRVPSIEEMEEAVEEPVLVSGGKTGETAGASGWAGGGKGEGGVSAADAEGKISLNKATKEELMTLPGIGESKAEAILNYRREQGGFENVEEIMRISGIKEVVYQKIKDKIMI